MALRPRTVCIAAALALAACGGGGSEGADSSGTPVDVETTASDQPEIDLPFFENDFVRVCNTQVGFAGATPLSAGPGPHPVVLFQETDSGNLFASSVDLPAGWAVQQDDNFDDNSDLMPTELVACSQAVNKSANGVSCDLELDDGGVVTLSLVDVTYELHVYEATTGVLAGTETIEAFDTDCPTFVFIDEGQTEYVNTPDADQYINALKSYVTP